MRKVLNVILVAFLLLGGIAIWPYLYNHHLFSLAQLKNSIEIGDSYQEVKSKFDSYKMEHEGTDDLQVSIEREQLFAYHVNSFDDCQLTVIFGSIGKVQKVKYIGD